MPSPRNTISKRRIILAITGASGIGYALTLLRALTADSEVEPHLIVSSAAETVLRLETGLEVADLPLDRVTVHSCLDMAAPPASGSWPHRGMVVCPCSMASLAAISQGTGSNLIHRTADVTLKEKRPLILVPRETPVHRIHLQNMLRLSEAGATLLPACPGFYHQPQSIQDLINHLVGRILDHLDVAHTLAPRWGDAGPHPHTPAWT